MLTPTNFVRGQYTVPMLRFEYCPYALGTKVLDFPVDPPKG